MKVTDSVQYNMRGLHVLVIKMCFEERNEDAS